MTDLQIAPFPHRFRPRLPRFASVLVVCLLMAPIRAEQPPPKAELPADPLQRAERVAQSDAAQAIDIGQSVLQTARASGDRQREAAALRVIAIAQYFQADFPSALERAVAAERLFSELGDLERQASLLSLIGAIHGSSKQLDAALEVYERALVVSRAAEAAGGEGIVLMNLGKTQFDLGNYDEARRRYGQALEIFDTVTAAGDPPRPDAVLFARMGIADAALRQGQPDLAIEGGRAVLAAADRNDLIYQNAIAILGEAHLARGDLDAAERYLVEARDEAERTRRPTKRVESMNLLARLAEARGDLTEALALQRAVSTLNLEIYSERNSAELARLQARYERDLQNQRIELQDLQLERNRSTIIAISVMAGAALLLALVAFQLYRVTQRSQKALRVLAETDPLTGLLNRRTMYTHLARVSAENPTPMSLCLLDIDNFKAVNDHYGHQVGDRVLVAIADALRLAIRKGDQVARWGGEEFLVLLSGRARSEVAHAAKRLCESVASVAIDVAPDRKVHVTTSVGVAEFSPGVTDTEVIHRADVSMYQAKLAGKNRVMTWDEASSLAPAG